MKITNTIVTILMIISVLLFVGIFFYGKFRIRNRVDVSIARPGSFEVGLATRKFDEVLSFSGYIFPSTFVYQIGSCKSKKFHWDFIDDDLALVNKNFRQMMGK